MTLLDVELEYQRREQAARAEAEAAQRRLAFLAEASSLLGGSLDYEATLAEVARLAVPTIADLCMIDLLEEDGRARRVAVAHRGPAEAAAASAVPPLAHPLPPDNGQTTSLAGAVPSLVSVALVGASAGDEHGPERPPQARASDRSASMVVPLQARDRVLGVLTLAALDPARRYGPADLTLAEDLARRCALAVENARLYAQARRRLAELTTVQQVARAINSALRLDEIFQTVVTQISTAFGYRMVSIYLREGDGLALQAYVGYDEVLWFIRLDQGVSGRVARTGQGVFVRDAAADRDFIVVRPGICQGIIVPLKTREGEVLGTLLVESDGDPRLTDDDFALLLLLADQVSVAVANARLFADLHESEQRFRTAFRHAPIGMALVGTDGRWLQVNRAVCEMLGYQESELLAMRFQDLTHPDDLQADLENLQRTLAGAMDSYQMEKRYLHKSGRVVWALLSVSLVRDRSGAPMHFVSQILDITERKSFEARLAHLATHDTLTGLANRSLFHDRLHRAILSARRDQKALALMVIDLDNFKEVNDTLGHQAGDLLLQQVGARLQGALRESDTVARLGGDEFAVVLPTAANAAGALLATRRIIGALEPPFAIDGHLLHAEASIGIALYPDHGSDAETLLRRADIAMYTAKRAGSVYAFYAPQQDQHSLDRLTLVAALRQAIEQDQLVLYYQPEVCLADGQVCGLEALARWHHPQHGLLAPDQFIPLAEQTGLIKPLARWVIATALQQCRAWQAAGIAAGVAVNLSARNLQDPELPDQVATLLERSGVAPVWLELEITETALMVDPPRALKTLSRLRAMGVRLAIDDFGTGYSSLAFLKRLPLDTIKIDTSFVVNLAADSDDAAIVRSSIDLAHNLGLQVVAEGVETRTTLELLAALGCDMAQGTYLGPPLPAPDLLPWLAARQPPASPAARGHAPSARQRRSRRRAGPTGRPRGRGT